MLSYALILPKSFGDISSNQLSQITKMSERDTKFFMQFPGFTGAVSAISQVNQAMRSAAENPMDKGRRAAVRNAISALPNAIIGLAQEFQAGSLHNGDLPKVLAMFGGFVDVNAADRYKKFLQNPSKDLIPELGQGFPTSTGSAAPTITSPSIALADFPSETKKEAPKPSVDSQQIANLSATSDVSNQGSGASASVGFNEEAAEPEESSAAPAASLANLNAETSAEPNALASASGARIEQILSQDRSELSIEKAKPNDSFLAGVNRELSSIEKMMGEEEEAPPCDAELDENCINEDGVFQLGVEKEEAERKKQLLKNSRRGKQAARSVPYRLKTKAKNWRFVTGAIPSLLPVASAGREEDFLEEPRFGGGLFRFREESSDLDRVLCDQCIADQGIEECLSDPVCQGILEFKTDRDKDKKDKGGSKGSGGGSGGGGGGSPGGGGGSSGGGGGGLAGALQGAGAIAAAIAGPVAQAKVAAIGAKADMRIASEAARSAITQNKDNGQLASDLAKNSASMNRDNLIGAAAMSSIRTNAELNRFKAQAVISDRQGQREDALFRAKLNLQDKQLTQQTALQSQVQAGLFQLAQQQAVAAQVMAGLRTSGSGAVGGANRLTSTLSPVQVAQGIPTAGGGFGTPFGSPFVRSARLGRSGVRLRSANSRFGGRSPFVGLMSARSRGSRSILSRRSALSQLLKDRKALVEGSTRDDRKGIRSLIAKKSKRGRALAKLRLKSKGIPHRQIGRALVGRRGAGAHLKSSTRAVNRRHYRRRSIR